MFKATVTRGDAWAVTARYTVENGPSYPGSNCPSFMRFGPIRSEYSYRWDVRFPSGYEFLDASKLSHREAVAYAARTVRKIREAA